MCTGSAARRRTWTSHSARDPALVHEYTNKGNLVAVVSNGTSVLGLGDIGALAGKPVMEGKGVLFKRFADIDVFDIEIDTRDSPAMAAGLADHVWSLREWLTFPARSK